VTATNNFDRLAQNWIRWSDVAQLHSLSVSTDCDDCDILFSSDEYAVHLRSEGQWWVVDTVDDRKQRHNDTVRFSNYALAEKYLVWIWASAARSAAGAPALGRQFYDAGFDPGVEKTRISPGIYELRSKEGSAVLVEPYATIFSHLMGKTEEEIEHMVRPGV
jgi:hypothetical protein